MHACTHTNIHTYIHTYIHTAYVHTYIHTYILHTNIHIYIHQYYVFGKSVLHIIYFPFCAMEQFLLIKSCVEGQNFAF